MRRLSLKSMVFWVAILAAGDRLAQADEFANRVDLELVLAVDISRSMDLGEQILQRRGYVEAFRSAEVINAIQGGIWGRIAVTFVEWSGSGAARVVVPWRLVEDSESSHRFAEELGSQDPIRISRTSISGALEFSRDLFGTGGWQGLRRVIDISGDGPNNHGHPVKPVSLETADMGITINGLPLMVRNSTFGFGIENLDEYYFDCVIGGTGAFVVPVRNWEEFPRAVRRKLVQEIAGFTPARVYRIADGAGAGDAGRETVDCMIGEKLWQDRMRDLEWR